MDTSEPHDLHRPWLHQTVTILRDSWNQRARRGCFQGVGSSSKGHDAPDFSSHLGATWKALDRRLSAPLKLNRTARRIRGRTPRLRSDRTAIVVRSSCDRGSSIVESRPRCTPHNSKECGFLLEAKFQRSCFLFEAKLKAIVARSLHLLEAKLEWICRGIEAMIYVHRIAPTSPSNDAHDRFNCP